MVVRPPAGQFEPFLGPQVSAGHGSVDRGQPIEDGAAQIQTALMLRAAALHMVTERGPGGKGVNIRQRVAPSGVGGVLQKGARVISEPGH